MLDKKRRSSIPALTPGAALALLLGGAGVTTAVNAEDSGARVLEEVVVTARRQDETLQDVPVTITSVGGEQLDNFQLDQPAEIAERIPNFRIQTGGSGSGGTLNLRGVGSSAISAAFDSAVALDIDGVQISRMRMVQSAFMDLEQVDVLKGPQSLYFGKSASAGVVSFRSANPGDEFEAKIGGGYDFELDGSYIDGFISAPINDTMGVRLAARWSKADELWENTAPGVQNRNVGEEDFGGRLTFVWAPSDTVNVNFKTTYTDHEGDNALGNTDVVCSVPGDPQNSNFAAASLPSGHDCNSDDGRVAVGDPSAVHGANFNGVQGLRPFEELETLLSRVQVDWDINDNMTLTSVSSYFELDEEGSACYGYDVNGIGCNTTINTTEAWAQEFRLAGQIGDNVSFLLGAFYQDRELVFDTAQHAIGAAQFNVLFGAPLGAGSSPGADPFTNLTSDWRKIHTTDSETFSVFGSVTVQATERLELTAGVRYSEDDRSQVVTVPDIHAITTFGPFAGGFVPAGFDSGDIEFDDDNVSPEVSVLYAVSDEINLFAAYKTGYKSGGVDNSALPSASLSAAALSGDFGPLIFETEEGEGFEVGMKGRFYDGTLRLDVTAFSYEYTDLQVQSFDSQAVQFSTTNAGELTSEGIEAEFTWLPNVEGLRLYGSVGLLDAKFSESFSPQAPDSITDPAILAQYDLDGRATSGAADFAFNVGLDYNRPLGQSLEWGFNLNTSFTDDYHTQNEDPLGIVQDSFWLLNTRVSLGSNDGRWKLSAFARNLTDEIYTITSGGRPFADVSNNTLLPGGIGLSDTIVNQNRGREVFLNFEIRL